ncbi:hypothetical protein [Acetobacter senegalensis]|uniref:hypothetical protein n=1 Tax=Acetobacter senegalensis TaxID=446692 RepID=UPI000AE1FD6A|nr:hypothetical protein [Acetobacter senegalensis]MCG4255312.1 hypothetical protein [Acetobacter senegalensis]MCG4258695.1 hypothetical protein [Acetobacter senegalensis]MCG4262421.1 hypothetical protein [Acetobacter senegalensis]
MKIKDHITSAATQVGDFLTFAKQDESGLLSVINDILGPVPQPDHPSKLEERASAAGMIDVIRYWQATDKAPPATEEEISPSYSCGWARYLSCGAKPDDNRRNPEGRP